MGKKGREHRPPGMMDVAKAAGVSHQTVSRVLNNSDKVAPHTREAVLKAIADLGYRRNLVARALVTSRSRIIGIISAAEPAYGPSSMLLAIEIAARRAGYYTGVAPIIKWDRDSLWDAINHLLSLAVEAIVVIAPIEYEDMGEQIDRIQVPIIAVTAGSYLEGTSAVNIRIDQAGAVEQVVAHLAALGHRDIVHVCGPLEWFDASARKLAWEESLKRHGLPQARLYGGGWDAETGYDAGRQMIQDGLPSAVFAANDVLAIGVIHALAEAGVEIPADVSIVGFDDIPGVSHLRPPLTTIRQDFEQLGTTVIETMKATIEGSAELNKVNVAANLIVRGSTAPARG